MALANLSIAYVGFYLAIGVAGLLTLVDSFVYQSDGRPDFAVALVPMVLGGVALIVTSFGGLTGIGPGIGMVAESIPRLESIDRFNQDVISSMVVLLTFVVVPRVYLGISGSPTVRRASDLLARS